MTTNDGGPAFPCHAEWVADDSGEFKAVSERHEGVSRLDYFAAAALTGVLASDVNNDHGVEKCAEIAFLLAQAMLDESNRRKGIPSDPRPTNPTATTP